MNNLTDDCIAIDTNVFLHLLYPHNNTCGHISKLLGALSKDKISLIVDSCNIIEDEYEQEISRRFKATHDRGNNLQLLRAWFYSGSHYNKQMRMREIIQVECNDDLMTKIKRIIPEKTEAVDRKFVYVAFMAGRVLITNDEKHIVGGRPKTNPDRRERLKEETRKDRLFLQKAGTYDRTDILTSKEAHSKL